jgi:hypothetical protein
MGKYPGSKGYHSTKGYEIAGGHLRNEGGEVQGYLGLEHTAQTRFLP